MPPARDAQFGSICADCMLGTSGLQRGRKHLGSVPQAARIKGENGHLQPAYNGVATRLQAGRKPLATGLQSQCNQRIT
jgi:hypothetical protein